MARRSPQARRDIIAGFQYGPRALTAADAAAAPPDDASDAETAPDADDSVDAAIAALDTALTALEAAQAADPGVDTDPDDKPVNADIEQLRTTLEQLKKDQATDDKGDDAGDAPADATTPPADAAPPPAAPASPPASSSADGSAFTLASSRAFAVAQPVTDPVDDNGNVDPDAVCTVPDCQHLASVHGDTAEGENQGACTTPGCTCTGMQVASQQTAPDGSDAADDGSEGTAGTEDPANAADATPGPAAANAHLAPGDVPPVAAPPAGDAEDQNAPPEMPGGSMLGPAFTIPCGLILGQPTGDGRSIDVNAEINWRVPPVPLMGMLSDTHDPNGWDMNDPAFLIGRIESFEIVPGEGDTKLVSAQGHFLGDEESLEYAAALEAMGRLGISADLAVDESQITVEEMDDDGWPMETSESVTKGTIMAMTMLPMAAFAGCYIVLDGSEAAAEPIPQAPPATAPQEVVASSAPPNAVHFLTYAECIPCESGIDVMVASAGPERPPAAWFAAPNFTVGDGRLVEILDKRGKLSLGGKYACPMTVTDEGEVYGHIAAWDVCHLGLSGKCITAPPSQVDYAHFKRGQHVITAEGDKVRVGVLTAGIGHAEREGISAGQAMAHYDDTRLAAANVNIGEDEYGIWVHGAVKPQATPAQIDMLRTSSVSGDWRRLGGNLELVAALCVNQPGFPLAVTAGGEVQSLVAAGAAVVALAGHPEIEIDDGLPAWARPALLRLAKSDARERLGATISV
jgi:hypothetical protein